MIKEIRLTWEDIASRDYLIINIIKEKGFPTEGSMLLKPKTGLKYYEFHDHKTGEIVVQWEE